ncbi:MAG: hypothetical protein M9921_05500 [Fimbriimonadaceae bacterium]|nr:hypothetical protein [Fimbriimonadaceae bacterium]
MRTIRTFAILAGVVAASVAPASELLTVHSLTAGKNANVSLNYFGSTLNVVSGPQLASLDGGAMFDAYCVDLTHWNTIPSSYPVNSLSTDLLSNGQRIAYLYNTYAATVASSTQGAALQLAIWDVLVDNGDGLSSGNLKSSVGGGILTQANAYLAASVGQSAQANYLKATGHGTGGNYYQDLVGPCGPGPTVPGPAAALPFLTSAFAMRRRAKRGK